MTDLARLSDHDLDRILTGRAPAGDPVAQELAAVVAEIKKTYVQAPTELVAASHIARMTELARSSAGKDGYAVQARAIPESDGYAVRRRRSRPVRLLLKLGASAAALSVVMGGLALAGVDVPAAVRDVLGIDADETASTPAHSSQESETGSVESDQASGASATFVQDLLDFIRTSSDEGCDFGQGVAAIVTGGSGGSPDACDQGSTDAAKGSKATGDEASSGRSAGAGSPRGSKATGDEASEGKSAGSGSPQGSRATGEDASGAAGDVVPDDIPGGPETGEEASEKGRGKADSHKP